MGGVVVSVVIPAYNSARVLDRTLETVRSQTFTDHETIVVDDGSVDGTPEVAEAYFRAHSMRGRVVRRAHCGIAAARNAGLRDATAAHVALLDSDDVWYPEKLEVVMDEFARHPDVGLLCHDEKISRDGRIVRVTRRRTPRGNMYEALLFRGNLLSPSASVMKRDAALAIGGFDERPAYHTVEDYDFWLRFSRRWSIQFLNRVLGEYVVHDRSATNSGLVAHYRNLEGMLRDHLTAYLRADGGPWPRLRARRRLGAVYRAAARQLIERGEAAAEQRAFLGRMLRTYPFEPRNVAVTVLWLGHAWRRTS